MGRLEPTRRRREAARSPSSLFSGRVLFRGKVAISASLWRPRVKVSLSIARPLLAIWFGTPSRLSPRPFHTPVKSGCPSAVRGVVPDGFGGALPVRGICENSCAGTAAGRRQSAAAAATILLYPDKRIRTSSLLIDRWHPW